MKQLYQGRWDENMMADYSEKRSTSEKKIQKGKYRYEGLSNAKESALYNKKMTVFIQPWKTNTNLTYV